MTNQEAIEVIKSNWPDESFTMLREALTLAMISLSNLKFKVGDRVKVVSLKDHDESENGDYDKKYLNEIGTIYKVYNYYYPYLINFDKIHTNKNDEYFWHESNLELVNE